MKNLFKCLYIYIVFLSILSFFSSCSQTGLGEEVDLEAPVLKVTELISDNTSNTDFSGGASVKTAITFNGTATDNNRVDRVYLQVKWSDEESFKTLASTGVSGDNWSLSLTFEKEGSCFVYIVAEDPVKNISPNSTKTIPLRVDNSAPVASSWYIDREIGGIQYNLREKDDLEKVNLDLAENKDAAQNVNFTICCNATDLFGIAQDGVKIQIFDEEGKAIGEPIENSAETGYAPKFKVTHDALVAGDSNLAKGKHYLQVKYYAEDDVEGMSSPNTTDGFEFPVGWFIWWPESDLPRITNSEISTDSSTGAQSMNVHIKDSLNLSFFDDDYLKKGYFALLTEKEYTDFGTVDWNVIKNSPTTIQEAVKGWNNTDGSVGESEADAKANRTATFEAKNDERETSIVLKASDTPQTMHLLAIGWDTTEDENRESQMVTKDIAVHVTDGSTPILLITSPKNNSVPEVQMGGANNTEKAEVTITGQTLDSAGCAYLEFVWVPDTLVTATGKDKKTLAREWLDSLNEDSKHDALKPSSEDSKITTNGASNEGEDGLKLWSVKLSDNGTQSGFYSSKFNFTIDLFSDFTYNSADERKNTKYFLAKLTRKDGNSIYQDYILTADTSLPEIVAVTPGVDGTIVDVANDYVLEFYAQKESGLAIDTEKYKIELVGLDSSLDSNNKPKQIEGSTTLVGEYKQGIANSSINTYQYTVSKEFLAALKADGIMPKFKFTATDVFGLTGSAQYSLSLTDLPALQSISSTSSTLRKLGDEILINASFSNTVTVTSGYKPYLKLKNINGSASNRDKAYYESGSGSTTLTFKYTVQEGDTSDALEIDFTSGQSPIETEGAPSLTGANVILTTLTESGIKIGTGANQKVIKIDGVSPKATLSLSSENTDDNKKDGVTYLRAGRVLTLTLTTDKVVTVQGSPAADFLVGSSSVITLPIKSTVTSGTGTTITFQRTILSNDTNGTLTFKEITNYDVIKDSAGNPINIVSAPSESFVIDTEAPSAPTISGVESKKYGGPVSFTLQNTSDDIRETKYSLDDGVTWKDYTESTSVTASSELTAKSIDYAGNESPNAPTVSIDINSTFPSFTVECTDADGMYPAGKTLTFNVYFANALVTPSDSSSAYIQLSAADGGTVGGVGSSNNGRATFKSLSSDGKTAVFTYEVQDPDEFSLKLDEGAVNLTGFKDEYGCSWDASIKNPTYTRASLHCDGVAPKVKKMEVDGSKGNNVYSNGRKITLTFSEEVQIASGNITLRQVAGWAIPPVIGGDDFVTITNKLDKIDTTRNAHHILSMQVGNVDMEDGKDYGYRENTDHFANDKYFGTGHFCGPYKKSYQGLKDGGTPDLSTKYVLAFDLDIWDTDTSKTIKVGPTYKSNYAKSDFSATVSNTEVEFDLSKQETRSTQQIREVLEMAGYHERVLDVTSVSYGTTDSSTVDKTKIIIEFPAGLVGDAELPFGREWELVIDKGSFIDNTGNKFGAEANGVINQADAVQHADGEKGVQYTVTENGAAAASAYYAAYSGGSWKRGRSALSGSEKPVVLIKNGANESFFSDKVATPVVRIDRYSYGLGIYQPSGTSGGEITANKYISESLEKPTGLVRVKIDCQTEGATVTYVIDGSTGTESNGTVTRYTTTTASLPSYTATSSMSNPKTFTAGLGESNSFAAGTGNYKTSCKQYISALGEKTGFTISVQGSDAVWQTVVHVVKPTRNNGTVLATQGAGYNDFSIRGATGQGMEPSYSPFPLRNGLMTCPYLRRTYWERKDVSDSNDYYWVSYEIFLEAAMSGHGYRGSNFTWTQNDSKMEPGEVSTIHGLYLWN